MAADPPRPRKRTQRWNVRGNFNIHDVFALEAMRPLGEGSSPWTVYALAPRSLLRVLNTAALHDAQFIVEAGSGLSTVMLARYAKQYGDRNAKIVSIDDNGRWLKKIEGYLFAEDLLGYVDLIHAPLTEWTPDGEAPPPSDGTSWQFEIPAQWYNSDQFVRPLAIGRSTSCWWTARRAGARSRAIPRCRCSSTTWTMLRSSSSMTSAESRKRRSSRAGKHYGLRVRERGETSIAIGRT